MKHAEKSCGSIEDLSSCPQHHSSVACTHLHIVHLQRSILGDISAHQARAWVGVHLFLEAFSGGLPPRGNHPFSYLDDENLAQTALCHDVQLSGGRRVFFVGLADMNQKERQPDPFLHQRVWDFPCPDGYQHSRRRVLHKVHES